MSASIRPARKTDAPNILGLIKELAVYEKEPNAVKTSEEDLLRDGFGKNPLFECLVTEDTDSQKLLAMALYFFKWSTWEGRPTLYLEDLYVSESARGQGLGLSLFQRLATIAVERNCSRFEWEVLDWNQTARDFYHRQGASHKEGWLPYRLEGQALHSLAESDSASVG